MSERIDTTEGLVPPFTEALAERSESLKGEDGETNGLPDDDTADKGVVCVKKGFSKRYATPPWDTVTVGGESKTGLYPNRGELNRLAFLLSGLCPFLNKGGWFTFDQDVASRIDGYPAGAVLWYWNKTKGEMAQVVSLKTNSYDFNAQPEYIDGVNWRICSYTKEELESVFGDTVDAAVSAAGSAAKKLEAPDMSQASLAASGTKSFTATEPCWALLVFSDFAGMTLSKENGPSRQILSRRTCRKASFVIPLGAGQTVSSPTPFTVFTRAQYTPQTQGA